MSDDRCRGALVADFRRYYGLSWNTIRDSGIPLHEAADMAGWLPPDSATRRALDPHWQRTPDIDLLREVEHDLRVLAWQNTREGSRGRGFPEPLRLPWDPEDSSIVKGDRMTLDEAAEWLGWSDRLNGGEQVAR